MNIDKNEQEFREEVIRNPEDYPNLYATEVKKNKYKFQNK